MEKKICLAVALIPFSWAIVGSAFAEGCEDYPFVAGEIVVRDSLAECLRHPEITEPDQCGRSWLPAGFKILATGMATVDFDDEDDVMDARMEAEMEAKATISHFFTETIQSDKSIETATVKHVKLESSAEGETKTATKEKLKVTLRSLSSHSQALLRGVVKLSECYTKGKHVMLTVGMKPETMAAAAAITGAIGESVAETPTTTETTAAAAASDSSSSTGTAEPEGKAAEEGTESYSKGTKKAEDF